MEKSEKVWDFLKDQGFLDNRGKVLDALRTALKDNTLTLPEEFSDQEADIKDILRKLAGKLDIKNADERLTIRTREAVLESEDSNSFGIGSNTRPPTAWTLTTRSSSRIAELCRREGIADGLYYWSKEFLEAGKKRLAGDTQRQASSSEVKDLRRESRDLKEVRERLS